MAHLTGTSDETYTLEKIFPDAEDFLPLTGTDYVELYVGNAKQAAYFYKSAFGFQSLAYAGLETGIHDRTSYVVSQGKIRLVLTSALNSLNPIAEHLSRHGDAVKVIALQVPDADDAFMQTTRRGAKPVFEPREDFDSHGSVISSAIETYGDTIHVFVDRKNYKGPFLPGYEKWESDYNPDGIGLQYIDHMVGNVDWGQMNRWAGFYENVMGFTNLVSFDDKDISTEYSALMSKVMSNGNGRIKFPINEPAVGKRKSQIEEFIDFFEGPGCQHIAVATDDIVHTVTEMRQRGVEFLRVPGEYYDTVEQRVGSIDENLKKLKELGIMADRDEDGYLLQIFTKPVQDRPTMFFEIIQRKGAKSFGKGNFKALFESIEEEQRRRRTL